MVSQTVTSNTHCCACNRHDDNNDTENDNKDDDNDNTKQPMHMFIMYVCARIEVCVSGGGVLVVALHEEPAGLRARPRAQGRAFSSDPPHIVVPSRFRRSEVCPHRCALAGRQFRHPQHGVICPSWTAPAPPACAP